MRITEEKLKRIVRSVVREAAMGPFKGPFANLEGHIAEFDEVLRSGDREDVYSLQDILEEEIGELVAKMGPPKVWGVVEDIFKGGRYPKARGRVMGLVNRVASDWG